MSWQTLNKILARAMIDAGFASKLLLDPLQTVREAGFDLTLEEQQVFREAKVKDVSELSQILLTHLGHQKP